MSDKGSKMKILLADDNPEVRSALRLLLEQEPVSAMVLAVEDAQSLQEYLTGDCPLVLLLDWELPGLHSSDFLSLIHARCPKLKIVALSSKYEARQAALVAGVDAFVSKAEPPEKILSTIWGFLPKQEKE